MDYVTIDFEASCLPRHGRSFPVEVGVSGAWGTFSWLIKPQPQWREWGWTEEAFRLHGIGREQLNEEGDEPAIVVAELLRAIGPARVIADSALDVAWWKILCDAVPASLEIGHHAIRIEHVSNIFDELGATDEQIMFAQHHADSLCWRRHRAGADSHWLWTLMAKLQQKIAADHARGLPTHCPSFESGRLTPSIPAYA